MLTPMRRRLMMGLLALLLSLASPQFLAPSVSRQDTPKVRYCFPIKDLCPWGRDSSNHSRP